MDFVGKDEGYDIFILGEPNSGLSASLMAFRRARLQTDEISTDLMSAEELDEFADHVRTSSGKLLFHESRRLMHDRDGAYAVYAVPTTSHQVCYIVSPSIAIDCIAGLTTYGISLAVHGKARDGSLWIHGLASDEVTGVDIFAGEQKYPAILGENFFVFRSSRLAESDITRIEVKSKTGTAVVNL